MLLFKLDHTCDLRHVMFTIIFISTDRSACFEGSVSRSSL